MAERSFFFFFFFFFVGGMLILSFWNCVFWWLSCDSSVYLVKPEGWRFIAATDVNDLHYKFSAERDAAAAGATASPEVRRERSEFLHPTIRALYPI